MRWRFLCSNGMNTFVDSMGGLRGVSLRIGGINSQGVEPKMGCSKAQGTRKEGGKEENMRKVQT